MTGKTFEMLKKDNTRYIVNAEKLNDLERLTTTTQLILTIIATEWSIKPCYMCKSIFEKLRIKLLDMQCLLVTVQAVKFALKQEAVTVNEIIDYCEKHYTTVQAVKFALKQEAVTVNGIIDYCKKHYTSALKETKKLIITAITNGYLKEYKNLNLKEV